MQPRIKLPFPYRWASVLRL